MLLVLGLRKFTLKHTPLYVTDVSDSEDSFLVFFSKSWVILFQVHHLLSLLPYYFYAILPVHRVNFCMKCEV